MSIIAKPLNPLAGKVADFSGRATTKTLMFEGCAHLGVPASAMQNRP